MDKFTASDLLALINAQSDRQPCWYPELKKAVTDRNYGLVSEILTSFAKENFQQVNENVIGLVSESLISQKHKPRKLKSQHIASDLDKRQVRKVISEVMTAHLTNETVNDVEHSRKI